MKFLIFALFLFLTGCATLSENECRQGDWFGLGYRDGVNGRLPSYINGHIDACASYGAAVNRAAWTRGREKGLTQYCTPQNAYHIGQAGSSLAPVCATTDERLQRANQQGKKYHQIRQALSSKKRSHQKLNKELKKLFDSKKAVKDVKYEIAFKQQKVTTLEKEIAKLDEQLRQFRPDY